ncbi:MAG: hypothetical protein GXP31_10435 [Kiritimatiellaeota bacterium]|nr:hypothetical protein [Kiritimatiellota bacterium]
MNKRGDGTRGSWVGIVTVVGIAVAVMAVVAVRVLGPDLKYLAPGEHQAPVKAPRRPARPPARLSDFIAKPSPQARGARCAEPWPDPAVVRTTLEAILKNGEQCAPRYAALFPADKDIHLHKDYLKKRKAWRRRVQVEAYNRFGTKDAKWDKPAREFLAHIAERFEGNLGADLRNSLYKQSSALIKLGCNDPFVVYCHGNLEHYIHGGAEAEPFVQAGLEGLDKKGYPRFFAYWAARRLADIYRQMYGGDAQVAKDLDRKALFYLGQAAADKIFQPDMMRVYSETLVPVATINPALADRLKPLLEGLDSVRDPAPWAAAVCRAAVYKALAWKSRGSGWGYTVSKDGWKEFGKKMKVAREAAEKAWALHPEIPEPACIMIDISMATCTKTDVLRWFQRAVAAEFDIDAAYYTLSWALLPRWGGTMDEQFGFGLACLQTGRFDTTVPWQVMRSLLYVGMDLHRNWRTLWLLPQVRRIVNQYHESYANQFADKKPPKSYLARMAAFAWATGQYDLAAECLDRAGPWARLNPSEVGAYNVPPMTPYREIAIATGKAGLTARNVLEKLDRGDIEAAAAEYLENAGAILQKSPEAAYTLMERIGAGKETPPPGKQAFTENLIEIWARQGYRERTLRACLAARSELGDSGPEPGWFAQTVARCGPYGLAFIELTPVDVPLDVDAIKSTFEAFQRRAAELREQYGIQPDSKEEKELVTARLVAEVRCLLHSAVKDRNHPDKFVDRIIMPRLDRVPLKGRLIDFVAEVGWQDMHGDPLLAYFAFKFYNHIQMVIEDDYEGRRRIMTEVAAAQSRDELATACRRTWMQYGGCRIALQCAALLRKRGLPAEAAWYENMVEHWAGNFASLSTATFNYWALWQVVDIYNSVRGYERETIAWGVPLMSMRGLNSTHYMVAHAYLRQGRYKDAAWTIMQGKVLEDDSDLFCTPDGVFQGTEQYVSALIRLLEECKELPDEWKDSLEKNFPALFLRGMATRPKRAPALPDKP